MLFIIVYLFILFQKRTIIPANVHGGSILATKSMSLNDRYPNQSVNEVFKQNILLTLAYMQQKNMTQTIDAKNVDKPFHYSLILHQGDVFAFHDNVLPVFSGKVVATTNAHFNGQEGFKSDGYLIGDGVCHLASLINYAAESAGLGVVAPTSHDFATIPEIPKQFGVAIFATPAPSYNSEEQNLYVTNTLAQDVTLVFDYHDAILKVTVVKQFS